MATILDKMFSRRFCLPADAEIENYEQGSVVINNCVCGNYNHVACVLKGKGRYLKEG